MKNKNLVHATLLTVAAPFSFVELSVFCFSNYVCVYVVCICMAYARGAALTREGRHRIRRR